MVCCAKKQDTPQQENTAVTSGETVAPQTFELIAFRDSVASPPDSAVIAQLDEPLKALAAFYAAMGGTDCNGENCGLTTALGLGKQGSPAHQNLIKKYFPEDKVAQTVLAQDCYLRPSGASTFSDFQSLKFTRSQDSVQVDYRLMTYNRGEITYTDGPDRYVFENGVFSKVSRNLWKFADQ